MAIEQERAELGRTVGPFAASETKAAELVELAPLAEADDEIAAELDGDLSRLQQQVQQLELSRLLSGPFDGQGAIVSVNAGAGGTESQDWAQMLLRMLMRWAERRDYGLELLDQQAGEEAGIKSATFSVDGAYAYGYLKGEVGVHRLVRISPYDAQKRRHTSFASVAVAPDIDDTIQVDIREEDVRVDTYRASGAGGQHVNKTDSAVRLTHVPSGVVVACQAERSQHKNRAKAWKMLRARMFERELQRREEEKEKLTGEKKKIEWGSQIRSYVLQPYRMVKDHRTGFEMGQADAVLDGDLDGFIGAYLSEMAKGENADD